MHGDRQHNVGPEISHRFVADKYSCIDNFSKLVPEGNKFSHTHQDLLWLISHKRTLKKFFHQVLIDFSSIASADDISQPVIIAAAFPFGVHLIDVYAKYFLTGRFRQDTLIQNIVIMLWLCAVFLDKDHIVFPWNVLRLIPLYAEYRNDGSFFQG